MLREIYGCKRVEVSGKFRLLHKEKLSIVRVANYRKLQWAQNVAQMEEMQNAYRISRGGPFWKVVAWRTKKKLGE